MLLTLVAAGTRHKGKVHDFCTQAVYEEPCYMYCIAPNVNCTLEHLTYNYCHMLNQSGEFSLNLHTRIVQ